MPPETLTEATARTLSYALGNLGGKQKSWMTDLPVMSAEPARRPPPRPPPVPRRGRPPKQTPAQPQAMKPPRQSIEPHAERQSSSNSTSPQLANVVTRQESDSHGGFAVTVFPSPTPSEEDPANASTPPPPPPPPPPPGEMAAPANMIVDADTSLETVLMDALHTAGASKRPAPAQLSSQPAEKRSRPGGAGNSPNLTFPSGMGSRNLEATTGQGQPATLAVTTDLPPLPYSDVPQHTRRPSVPQMHRQEQLATPAAATDLPRLPYSDVSAHPRRPSVPQMHSRSPSLDFRSNGQIQAPQSLQQNSHIRRNSRPTTQYPFYVPPEVNYGPPTLPAQHCASPASPWYTYDDCMRGLRAFCNSYAESPSHPRDGTRLAVLRDAVEKRDWHYLTMHQYYCMLSFDPNAVSLVLRSQQSLDEAIKLMQNVLDLNELLSRDVLRFFSNFPFPLEHISAMWPTEFQEQGQLFSSFVAQSPNYRTLKLMCEGRRYPPLAGELAIELSIASPTFQCLIFTAFFRYIWRAVPRDALERFEAQSIGMFRSNQAEYGHLRNVPRQNYHEKELEVRRWGTRHQSLAVSFEEELAKRGFLLGGHHRSPVLQQQRHQQPPLLAQTQPLHTESSPNLTSPSEIASRSGWPVNHHSAQPVIQQQRGQGRVRLQSVQEPHILPNQPVTQQPRAPVPAAQQPHRFLPRAGWIQPQQRLPNPSRFSLHLAHLRSPVLQSQSTPSPLYHSLVGFIRTPSRLSNAARGIEKWTFTLTPDEMQVIPKLAPIEPGGPDIGIITNKSKTVRLRCIKWASDDALKEHAWAVADTAWIPYSYLAFNGTCLQQRKKIHNGKDMPIDITGLLKEGENELEIAVIAPSTDKSHLDYLIAIEVLGVHSHHDIKQYCLRNRVPAARILQGVKDRLSLAVDDDEISIVESSITINLFDPFSASKMCDIPTRSIACTHNDCFDLETYLQTRSRKGDTSVPDQWRCPICNGDARPRQLLVDGFLEEVRNSLEGQGLSHTRAIIVQQDGIWKPKVEVRDPNCVSDLGASDDLSTSVEPQSAPPAAAAAPPPPEIIDLCD